MSTSLSILSGKHAVLSHSNAVLSQGAITVGKKRENESRCRKEAESELL
jgi:hypothetical protein